MYNGKCQYKMFNYNFLKSELTHSDSDIGSKEIIESLINAKTYYNTNDFNIYATNIIKAIDNNPAFLRTEEITKEILKSNKKNEFIYVSNYDYASYYLGLLIIKIVAEYLSNINNIYKNLELLITYKAYYELTKKIIEIIYNAKFNPEEMLEVLFIKSTFKKYLTELNNIDKKISKTIKNIPKNIIKNCETLVKIVKAFNIDYISLFTSNDIIEELSTPILILKLTTHNKNLLNDIDAITDSFNNIIRNILLTHSNESDEDKNQLKL